MKLKRDPYFTYVAVLLFAGVVLAFVNPTPPAAQADQAVVARNGGPAQPDRS